jgi:DNA-directed RNA polymerase sigma subunit (sigma70/sigma32)
VQGPSKSGKMSQAVAEKGIRHRCPQRSCESLAADRDHNADDQLSRSLSLDSLPYGEPWSAAKREPAGPDVARLYEYLQKEHPLLTPREKIVLARRYHLNDEAPTKKSLEQVGRELGLSKERVRQVQTSALGKLRAAVMA